MDPNRKGNKLAGPWNRVRPAHPMQCGRMIGKTVQKRRDGSRIKENGIIYFKIDGLYRSKLGLPASRATDICGSYDSSKGVLTILWCSLPETPSVYVNGQWGPQEDPFAGDVINSYNDGPVEDGSIMGPFYEIETSSPGAELAPGASLVHTQKVIHIQGKDEQLVPIVQDLFGADLNVIKTKFQ